MTEKKPVAPKPAIEFPDPLQCMADLVLGKVFDAVEETTDAAEAATTEVVKNGKKAKNAPVGGDSVESSNGVLGRIGIDIRHIFNEPKKAKLKSAPIISIPGSGASIAPDTKEEVDEADGGADDKE